MKTVRLLISFVAVLAAALGFSVLVADCFEYAQVYQDPIYVDAVVTGYGKDEDDDGTTYSSHVTYVLDGVKYKNVLYENGKSELSELDGKGTELTVAVNPENHGELVRHIVYPAQPFFWGALPLSAALAWCLKLFRRLRLTRWFAGTIPEETIISDLKTAVSARFFRVFFLFATISTLFLFLRFPMIFQTGYLVAACIFGGLWLLCLCSAVRDVSQIQSGAFEIRHQYLVGKREIEDTEGGYSWILEFSDETRTWERSVSGTVYRDSQVGATIRAVYLRGYKKPLVYYNMDGCAIAQTVFPSLLTGRTT